MNRLLGIALCALVLLAPARGWAHDPRLHKGNAVTGEIALVTGDNFDLKTAAGNIKVTFSSKTTFEHGKQKVDKSHLRKGDRVGVIGTKLPTGELVAKEILLGLPEPGKNAAKTGEKAKPAHKH
ncbi:MAG: OB-fold nucleic acid binding domain-containing protein [Acidobacteria bacterium]|nr:OB-fold nucleic acid binding domain-containing protein [Acidobacteriota bacterium]